MTMRMFRGKAARVVAAVGMSLAALPARAQVSEYASVAESDCRSPPPETMAVYQTLDLGVEICGTRSGIDLLLVSSDRSSWLDVVRGDRIWTTEDAVVYERPVGNFPNVGAGKVEWRLAPDGRPGALIFRVAGEAEGARRSLLFVVRLEADAACLLGRVATNEEARTLADGPGTCDEENQLPLRLGPR
ncbi:hypothetical protein JL101_016965 [Skermanella rosea]|uniref:hypothetical protein n=1 Tax=Skermanella rosea TaxID=1817965 RepID=UPI001E65E119|nr:hypothetical protein [Skermanella rosea]UEM01690.1 hypothetical protein JL101_016965 [Skermanella rosea]